MSLSDFLTIATIALAIPSAVVSFAAVVTIYQRYRHKRMHK
jgi:heme/copper-type cytochrome/quinol oxidase subunit 1